MEEVGVERVIAKYLSGEATREEMMTLVEWLSADEENKTEFCKIYSYWNADVSFMHAPEHLPDFEKLRKKIEKSRVKKSRSRLWLRPTVAVAVIIAGIFLLSQLVLKMNNSEVFTYITGSSVSDFILPDGTDVTLNKDSKLTYSTSFSSNNRMVSLDGEAYFDVVHDENRKFVVNVGNAKITVVGTVFSVNGKKGTDILKTSLVEGSVKFETSDQTIMLSPKKQISYNMRENEITVERFDPEIELAWKDNLIRYHSVSFKEFILLLEKHYNAEIILPLEEHKTSKLTGAVDASQSIDQIFDMMKRIINFEWRKEGDTYVITY